MKLSRRAAGTLLLGLLAPGLLLATEPDPVGLSLIRHRYIGLDEQIRIAEYLSGNEHPGDRIYLRTNPEEREGYYFVIRVPKEMRAQATATPGLIWTVSVYRPDGVGPFTHHFAHPTLADPGDPVYLGLTGDDWPDPSMVPIAWLLTLEDPQGSTSASHQSFLWRDPRNLPETTP